VIARAIEEAGIPTTSIGFVKEHMQRAKPPRGLWVPFPFGFALGKAHDAVFQHKVLRAALDLLNTETTPVLAEFPEDGDAPPSLIQASEAQASAINKSDDAADEITQLRVYYERWVNAHDGRTMVGLCGIPQRRFRGLIRYLQAFADGSDPDYKEKPEDMPTGRFIKLACDDLKAFYMEARMAQQPDERDSALQTWFWSQTAMGALVTKLAERFKADGNDLAAFGIAR
jgi:hypothetical protein